MSGPFFRSPSGDAEIYVGDCREVLAQMPESRFTACVTDPPYELACMGLKWDSTGVAFDPETWRAVLRVLKPGAFLLAFGGTRTFHRLTCAIEDAGFEIRDCMMWLYGQGFPKSLDISKAIDKAAGAEREVVGPGFRGGVGQGNVFGSVTRPLATAPATALVTEWDGWGTALKPAWEPIILAMKPLDGTFAKNARGHGVAGLNIDAARIAGAKPECTRGEGGKNGRFGPIGAQGRIVDDGMGRWPANVILSHHPDCERIGTAKVKSSPGGSFQREKTSRGLPGGSFGQERAVDREKTDLQKPRYAGADGTEFIESWACHPDCPVRLLDEQAGERTSGTLLAGTQREGIGWRGGMGCTVRNSFIGSTGSASRFFYCVKASASERRGSKHPTVKPLDLMRWLVRMVTYPGDGNLILDPFAGSCTTLEACRSENVRGVGIELNKEYAAESLARLHQESLFAGAKNGGGR